MLWEEAERFRKLSGEDPNKTSIARIRGFLDGYEKGGKSAEPEIIHCRDCKHRFLENQIWKCPFTIPASENHFCGYAERRPMSDSVSRRGAINAIKHAVQLIFPSTKIDNILDAQENALKELPSVEPDVIHCGDCKYYDGRPCGIVDYYNTDSDFCSRAERRTDEVQNS